MKVYTLQEAARKALMGVETLKRACEAGLVKAVRLPNGQWRIAESALDEALHEGMDLTQVPARSRAKNPQPEALRKAAEARRRATGGEHKQDGGPKAA